MAQPRAEGSGPRRDRGARATTQAPSPSWSSATGFPCSVPWDPPAAGRGSAAVFPLGGDSTLALPFWHVLQLLSLFLYMYMLEIKDNILSREWV